MTLQDCQDDKKEMQVLFFRDEDAMYHFLRYNWDSELQGDVHIKKHKDAFHVTFDKEVILK